VDGRYRGDGGSDARHTSAEVCDANVLELAICNEERYLGSLLLENLGDGIVGHTLDGQVVYANRRIADMLGYTHDQFMSLPPWGWIVSDRRGQLTSLLDQIRASGGLVFESLCIGSNGEVVCVEISSRIIDAEPWGRLCVSVTRDASVRVAAHETMRRMAFYDSLTGLSNRAMLEDRLQAAVDAAEQNSHIVGVIYMDLDDFKPVNDAYGHAMGDRVLGVVGERLQGCVRETDTIARVGGDEFIALFPRLNAGTDLSGKARALAESVSQPIAIDGAIVSLSASVGLATYRPGEHQDELICRADHAMYRAKMHGLAGWEEFLASELLDR